MLSGLTKEEEKIFKIQNTQAAGIGFKYIVVQQPHVFGLVMYCEGSRRAKW